MHLIYRLSDDARRTEAVAMRDTAATRTVEIHPTPELVAAASWSGKPEVLVIDASHDELSLHHGAVVRGYGGAHSHLRGAVAQRVLDAAAGTVWATMLVRHLHDRARAAATHAKLVADVQRAEAALARDTLQRVEAQQRADRRTLLHAACAWLEHGDVARAAGEWATRRALRRAVVECPDDELLASRGEYLYNVACKGLRDAWADAVEDVLVGVGDAALLRAGIGHARLGRLAGLPGTLGEVWLCDTDASAEWWLRLGSERYLPTEDAYAVLDAAREAARSLAAACPIKDGRAVAAVGQVRRADWTPAARATNYRTVIPVAMMHPLLPDVMTLVVVAEPLSALTGIDDDDE